MQPKGQQLIRALFDEYIEMYAARDDRLTRRLSENFSGYTGSGDFLVKGKDEWVRITRQDFVQVPDRIRLEMLDITQQDISDDVVVVSATFHIHLPIPEHILSRKRTRLVVIFRFEDDDWKIVHSGTSLPYHPAKEGEVYPLDSLQERSRELELLVQQRTQALEEANNKLQELSNTDGLTGIANRRSFDRMLAQEWSRAQRTGLPLALILLDVDRFKQFNDHYGHLAGDDCLKALARAMAQAVRRTGDLVARYGGEEFVVLLPNTNGQGALETTGHIQREVWALALPHVKSAPGIVTFSMGVASLQPSAQNSPEDLIQLADAALYRTKQSGGNDVQLAAVPGGDSSAAANGSASRH